MRRLMATLTVLGVLGGAVSAQEPPKPGKEHQILKRMEGTWDVSFKMMGETVKGKAVYKMDLGGLWLRSELEMKMFGQDFKGVGFDSYDAGKKKYVGLWIDSMSVSAMSLEGTYDAAKKTMTMTGIGAGPDGKPAKHKAVSVEKDADTTEFKMYLVDDAGKETMMFEIEYKRKK